MKSKKKWNIIIGVYEIIGGLLGLGITLFLTFKILPNLLGKSSLTDIFLILIILFALALYVLSGIAGFLLWKKQKSVLSIIVQAFQIPTFSIAGFSYLFISGLQLGFSIGARTIDFLFYLGSQWSISYNTANPFLLGINLVPIIIIYYLLRQERKK